VRNVQRLFGFRVARLLDERTQQRVESALYLGEYHVQRAIVEEHIVRVAEHYVVSRGVV
jgi:hypothetical protein